MRSFHVVNQSPEEFTSQMTGRLRNHIAQSDVAAFLEELEAREPRPRLRPILFDQQLRHAHELN